MAAKSHLEREQKNGDDNNDDDDIDENSNRSQSKYYNNQGSNKKSGKEKQKNNGSNNNTSNKNCKIIRVTTKIMNHSDNQPVVLSTTYNNHKNNENQGTMIVATVTRIALNKNNINSNEDSNKNIMQSVCMGFTWRT